MTTNEELLLLIKSKYPVVFFESIDELHTIRQLRALAEQLDLTFYQWSITDGLAVDATDGTFYDTKAPVKMLGTIRELQRPSRGIPVKPGLFVLKDFHRYLAEPVPLRMFRDLVHHFRHTRNTVVVLAPECTIPKEIEGDSAHVVGGYPVEEEIEAAIRETFCELQRTNENVRFCLSGDELRKVVTALKGLSMQQIRNVVNQCILDDDRFDIGDLDRIEIQKRKAFDQEGLLEFCLTEQRSNVAGFDNLKHWLTDRRDSFGLGPQSNLPVPRGILLMGVQGCGKSLCVKVIARELGLPLYRLDLARLYSKYIGETEQNLRRALAIVDRLSPLCLWFDEIEKGLAASSGDIDGGTSQRLLGTFLTWMQERKSVCFIAATANDVHRLPPELLRKGRFDEIFFVDLPGRTEREQLFRIHLAKRGLRPEDYDLKPLVAATSGFSGAEVEQAIISALYRANSTKEPMSTEQVLVQIRSTKPLSVLKQEEVSRLREWARERTIPA